MPNRKWAKKEHPNRPVNFTVAQQLHCGSVLHKGECRESDQLYHGDHRHTRYYVIGLELDERQGKFSIALADEYQMMPLHLTMQEMLGYHRVEDCASHVRRSYVRATHKPSAAQQLKLPERTRQKGK